MKNKKGVFFTFISIFLIILIIAIVNTKEAFRYRERSNAISSRIITMNNFVEDFERDIQREIFIGGYRSLISMNSYVRQIQGPVTNFKEIYTEILVNGTANGTQMDLMVQEGQKASIKGWQERINEEAAEMNIVVDTQVNNVEIEHISPWEVQVTLNATIGISDIMDLASWEFTKEYKQIFLIQGFEDPLYTIHTYDRVTNLVNKTPYTSYIGPNNDTTNLEQHYIESYYVESSNAPSFLMRFSDNLSSSPFGIESMVNVEKLYAQDPLLYEERSVIDYIYFNNNIITWDEYCNFTDMSDDVRPWFRIDDTDNHLDDYGLADLEKTGC